MMRVINGASGPTQQSIVRPLMDRETALKFLMDTGVDISIILHSALSGRRPKSQYTLFTGINTNISTYRFLILTLNMGFHQACDDLKANLNSTKIKK